MFDVKLFLKALKSLSESRNTQYRIGGPVQFKNANFDSNCQQFANTIDTASKKSTAFQAQLLKSIARHVRAKNLHLAQKAIDGLDRGTKELIPSTILNFISRYS
jgi:hypothetical protein